MASWLESEPELVALLTSWEPSTTSDAVSETVDSADESGHEPAGRRRVRRAGSAHMNQSRERQKQEIRALAKLVVELERELQHRKQHRAQILRPHTSAPPSSALLAWENMATRHCQARRRAETLNARLKAMLRTQQGVADSFRAAIRRAEQARQDAYATALFSTTPSSGSLLDSALCVRQQQLGQRLEQTSKQAYLPFARYAPFYSTLHSGTRVRDLYFFNSDVIRDDGADIALDIHSSTAYPFPSYLVDAALWQYFGKTCECDTTATALHGKLQSTSSQDGTHRRLTGHASRHRFRNADGELIIVSATCGKLSLSTTSPAKTPSGHSDEVVEAMFMQDSWVRILDLPSRQRKGGKTADPAADASPVTVIQHVRRSRVQFDGSTRLSTRDTETVKTALVAIAETQIRWGQEALEQLLMTMVREQAQQMAPQPV